MIVITVSPAISRSPHGERGLKSRDRASERETVRRSPHGERGLKCMGCVACEIAHESLSSRRAWIEIRMDELSQRQNHVALLTESVD